MDAIQIEGLCKTYGDFSLQNVSFRLPEGCILGLVGENGAGKSTTLRLLMGAAQRDSGTVAVLGTDCASTAFTHVKDDIGVVLDESYFPEMLTAKNVGSILRDTYTAWDDALFQALLQRFALPEGKVFKDYSRGMKMKLAIAAALAHHPHLLVLDEATSGLDPMVRDDILDLLRDFVREGDRSVLLSSHIVSDLEKVCDYIAFLHRGRLLLCEEKDRLMEEYAVLRLTRAQVADVPPEAVVSTRETPYATELLVRAAQVSPALPREHATLEDIILFLAKGGDRA